MLTESWGRQRPKYLRLAATADRLAGRSGMDAIADAIGKEGDGRCDWGRKLPLHRPPHPAAASRCCRPAARDRPPSHLPPLCRAMSTSPETATDVHARPLFPMMRPEASVPPEEVRRCWWWSGGAQEQPACRWPLAIRMGAHKPPVQPLVLLHSSPCLSTPSCAAHALSARPSCLTAGEHGSGPSRWQAGMCLMLCTSIHSPYLLAAFLLHCHL